MGTRSRRSDADELDPGADPAIAGPKGPPYTVFFPVDGTLRPADLEHPSSLPRKGDVVEYIDEQGRCHRFEVAEVIHTLQVAADRRPRVRDEAIPSAFARDERQAAEMPGDGGLIRAGLPKVILREAPSTASTREEGGFTVRRSDVAGSAASAAPRAGATRRRGSPRGGAKGASGGG